MAEFRVRLVEADRSARVLEHGRRIWGTVVPAVLAFCGLSLGAWLAMYPALEEGPGADFLDPWDFFAQLLGERGFYNGGAGCVGWSLLLGCEPEFVTWWQGWEAGFGFGVAIALLVSAWWLPRLVRRRFGLWEQQEAPLSACLAALVDCREAFRTPSPDTSVLDASVARLRADLQAFASRGVPADAERRAELEEHSGHVAWTLHEAVGRVLREGAAVLPDLVRILAQLQDRLHASRWYALLDASLITATPSSPSSPSASAGPATPTVGDSGRWQRHLAIATAMPAIPALLALGFTAMTISQARDTLRVTERDQVASSYSELVANLGDPSMNVRISSIYGLQRMMEESPREQQAIVNVLSAYVRDRAKAPRAKTQIEAVHRDPKARPADDVQEALNVLGARPHSNEDRVQVINLRNAFLVGADLSTGDFSDVDLREADVTRASLKDGRYDGSRFDGATMNEADLSGGYFADSQFAGSALKGAALRRAILDDADLSGAKLIDADLTDALLRRADFTADDDKGLPAADLTRTDFTRAVLEDADLAGTDRRSAVWTSAVLPK
ncbi:pentapeptide repeat-containing protein [Streptomyces sp. NPDC054975]